MRPGTPLLRESVPASEQKLGASSQAVYATVESGSTSSMSVCERVRAVRMLGSLVDSPPLQTLCDEARAHFSAGYAGVHLLTDEERKQVPKIKDLWIDIGASDRDEAAQKVRVGDPVTFYLKLEIQIPGP